MNPHFFFGTLRDRDVLELVLGRALDDLAHEPARCPGHRLARVVEESYPALIAAPAHTVEGEIVHGLGETDTARIAWFEGKEYATETVEVIVEATGARVRATIHLPTGLLEIEPAEWDYAAWRRDEKDELMRLARVHMTLMGDVDIDEAIARWDERREGLAGKRRDG